MGGISLLLNLKKKIGGFSSRFGVGIIYGSRVVFATRLKNGEIQTFTRDTSSCSKFSKIPFFRSLLVFRQIILIFLLGRKNLRKLAKKDLIDLHRGKRILQGLLFLLLYIGFFILFDLLIANFIPLIRWTILVCALLLLIRLFFYLVLGDQSLKYHGAEHKVINTFLSGDPLILQTAKRHSRLAFRCGTTLATFFILLELLTPEKIYLLFMHLFGDYMGLILVSFLILGFAYESLSILSRKKAHKYLSWLKIPISKMQLFTTREPSIKELEVALSAIQEAVGRQEPFIYSFNDFIYPDPPDHQRGYPK